MIRLCSAEKFIAAAALCAQSTSVDCSSAVEAVLQQMMRNMGRALSSAAAGISVSDIDVQMPVDQLNSDELDELCEILRRSGWCVVRMDRTRLAVRPYDPSAAAPYMTKECMIVNGLWCGSCDCATVFSDCNAAGEHLLHGFVYMCPKCGASVSVHPGTRIPKGSVVTGYVKKLRIKVHKELDSLWHKEKLIERSDLYKMLAKELGIPYTECHVGKADQIMCDKMLGAIKRIRSKLLKM